MTKILVKAGNHRRESCFASVEFQEPIDAGKVWHLVGEDGKKVPCQVNENGKSLLFKVAELDAGCEAVYELKKGAAKCGAISVEKGKEPKSLDILVDGKLFTTLHCCKKWAKPFLWPVNSCSNVPVTRAYPMADVPGETNDHIHQKSMWTGWGEVNGWNLWEEVEKSGRILTNKIEIVEEGPLRAKIRLNLDWVNGVGKKLMAEVREYSFTADGEVRTIDCDVKFIAAYGDVFIGDTKEGGICSVRVATTMDGVNGGVITLSDGSIGEDECWGTHASWCDYYGDVEGGKTGICIMDNPVNDNFPTGWHVRNYGLMTANPYAEQYYRGNMAKNVSFAIQEGASKKWKFRVLLHDAPLAEARMPERYHDYAHAPVCTVI